MRNVARLKMGYYPLPEAEGMKLRSLLSFAEPASVIDPCVGQGTALHLITSDAQVRRYGVEFDAERARIARVNGIETIQGNAFDAIARSESFSLLYLNPPYDSEIGSIANRRMEAVFLEHTYRWLTMEGVLILVIPYERLRDCSGILCSHFASLNVFRMTDEDSVQYRQIAVLVQLATQMYPKRWNTDTPIRDLVDAMVSFDNEAMHVATVAGEYLGRGLALLIDAFNPQVIVLGALAGVLKERILAPAREVIAQEALPHARLACEILPSFLGSRIGDVAALMAALTQPSVRQALEGKIQ